MNDIDFYLPMNFKTKNNQLTVNDKNINIIGITWYGLETK